MTDTLALKLPDDWHLHVRDGAAMAAVVPHTARQFGRAIIMPNLKPPVTTAVQAVAYRERIRAAVPAGLRFEPLMTLYLTDNTPPEEIRRARSTRPGPRPTATPASPTSAAPTLRWRPCNVRACCCWCMVR
jgi:dihydroorotase